MVSVKVPSIAKLLIVLFVMAQGLTAVHMADYGLGEHKHHGQLCEIYLHAEKSHFADIGSVPVCGLTATNYEAPPPLTLSNIDSYEPVFHHARAPPTFS